MLYFARWKVTLILAVLVIGLLYALPNALPENVRQSWPGFLPDKTMNLGLDLRGGSHLLFEVDIDAVRGERMEALVDDAKQVLREDPLIPHRVTVQNGAVEVRILGDGDMEEVADRLEDLARPVSGILVPGQSNPRSVSIEQVDDTTFRMVQTEDALEKLSRDIVQQSIEVIRKRIDEYGTTEPNIQRQGDNRILVQVPGLDDPERLKELIGQTAQMTFHLVYSDNPGDLTSAMQGRVPPGARLVPSDEAGQPDILVRRRAVLSGEDLKNAYQGSHPQTGAPVVNFSFNLSGAKIFGDITTDNVGRRFAIVLDDKVITAPRINSPITGGSGYIEGNFTIESATDLATLLNAGALPAPLTVVEERTVGAGLGADSIKAGEFAAVVGFLAVVVFVLIAYGVFGVFANIALFANVMLIAGVLSMLQATLTLPGIAGIILTIGMAVDANVLIFERIREESRAGRSPVNSVETGYTRALSTILDANITTLIAAVLLFQFGSGPVRGFAVTLGIGILTSVFTAFVLSRLIASLWLRMARPKTLPI
ncbi:MAG: protein translocase subunit SecD [Euryhalocaulis sp.]|uniref:protein translocase subunit SecD n=1 Tax=Euryhalocaulis sp. TaxID=2744307 RepID=UPI00185EE84E|nr:protein translocase subunit SecD [Euryhalocaulis sp.]MBA4800760.1 protein translocase subunit SecD [Euryhalocaulis sp.]